MIPDIKKISHKHINESTFKHRKDYAALQVEHTNRIFTKFSFLLR